MVKSFDAGSKGRRKAEFEEPIQCGRKTMSKRRPIDKLTPQAFQSEQPRRRKALTGELPPGPLETPIACYGTTRLDTASSVTSTWSHCGLLWQQTACLWPVPVCMSS